MASSEITLEAVPSISDIPAADWDACANPARCPATPTETAPSRRMDRPSAFRRTSATHQGHTITPSFRTHFSLPPKPPARPARAPAGARGISWPSRTTRSLGVVPCYLKSHSQGEYVFDRGWADAYERAGGSYYPKLQVSVPFTPATGPRLLIRDGVDRDSDPRRRWPQGLIALCDVSEASSVARHLRPRGGVDTAGRARLPAAHRPAVSLAQSGLCQLRRFSRHAQFAPAQGDQARAARGAGRRHHDPLADRQRHHRRRLGRLLRLLHGHRLAQMGPPLSDPRVLLADRRDAWPSDVLLVMAKRDGRWIAGAINFIGSDTLFGRNWGAIEHHPFLHFEVCYYQAIDFAIATRPAGGRGRRAGRAQDRARLPAADHLFRALHRRSRRCAGRSRTISSASAPMSPRPRANCPRPRRSARPQMRRLDHFRRQWAKVRRDFEELP